MSGTFAALLLVGTSVLNCAGGILNMVQVKRLARRAARQEDLYRCAGMVAFIASESSGAPPSLRRECAKILPPDLQITIHDLPSKVH